MRQMARTRKLREEQGPGPLPAFIEGFAGEEELGGDYGVLDRPPGSEARGKALKAGQVAGIASMVPGPKSLLAAAPIIARKILPKAAEKGAKRTVEGALVNLKLRERSPEEALAMAARGEHLRKGGEASGGMYVGGPRKITSPQALAANRARMDRELAASVREQEKHLGPQTGDWYASQRRGVEQIAEPYQQRRAAEAEGLFSSQTDPHGELGFHLTAKNRASLGLPVGVAHTGRQGEEYSRALRTGTPMKLGEKTDVYAQQSDPTRPFSPFGTNDFRQAQFMGYTEPGGAAQTTGLKPAQHAFIDAETLLLTDRANRKALGGRSQWSGHLAQEIPWVNEKADALMKQRPGLSRGEAMEIAAKTIEDYVPPYTASATYEAVPGKATGHVPRMIGSTPEAQRAYEAQGSWRTGEDPLLNTAMAPGRDKLYGALDMLQRPGVEGAGVYGTERNVVNVARPMVDLTSGPAGRTIAPETAGAMTEIERLRGAVDAQEAAAWHMPLAQSTRKAGSKTHGFLTMPQQATPEQMEAIIGAAPEGFFPSASSEGVMLFGPGNKSSQEVTALLRGATPGLERAAGVAPERIGMESSYIPIFAREGAPTPAGEGIVTSEILQGMAKQPPAVAQGLSESEAVRGAIAGKHQRDVLEGIAGQPVREDIQQMRRFLSEADWSRAVDMIRKGMTPAAAVAALGYSLSGMAEEAR